MYATVTVLLAGSQGNALTFGSSVILASTPAETKVDHRLQKLFAILIVGLVCLLQAYSRSLVVRLNNFIAIYKILLLSFFTVVGWCALRGYRTAAAARDFTTPYGSVNLQHAFAGTTHQPYGYGLALLVIQRAFNGYENANYVTRRLGFLGICEWFLTS
jgi:amino acid transporter